MTHLVLRFMLAMAAPGLLLPWTSAHAQPATSDKAKLKAARSYTEAGVTAQDVGDYDTAITFYSKAYELVPHPVLLFNIAQAHRLAGRLDQAAELYRRFLATSPTGPEAQIARELLA
ncbi:MAG TPA: tetratricopeptide repeat protein [Kofleriaceae bacterium]|nr:tetratricopeptide repeat protein [Kofleriaceae bacterium]